MLLGGKQSNIKQVAVVTRNQKFNRLLSSLLAEWKFFAVEDLNAATVVFAERGIDLPELEGQVVWLTPMPLSEGHFLVTPISLTSLYHLLEGRFFPTPRRHVRMNIECRAELKVDGQWQKCKLVSLSDRGGRLVCEKEIPRGTNVDIEMRLAGRSLQIAAETLYCIPAGDSPGRSQPQIGTLFKPSNGKVTDMLKGYIEKVTVEAACVREDIPLNDACLSWIDVPDDPWSI